MRNWRAGNAGMSPEATRTSCAFQFPLTRLLGLRAPPFSRSHHRTPAWDRRRRTTLLEGCSHAGAPAPLRRRRGSKTKGQREGREAAAREEAKLRSHTAGGEGERKPREKEGERARETERSFQGSSESASGASEGPRLVPHRRARALTAPGLLGKRS